MSVPRAMNFYVYEGGAFFQHQCANVFLRLGCRQVEEPRLAAVAIAPLLRRRLSREEYGAPREGTLVFHPSALPYRRGPDAIRQAIAAGERVSASTWFWCDEGLDTGPICEQELVVLQPGQAPKDAYVERFVPAALRALERAAEGILWRAPRRVPQEDSLATYDTWLRKERPPAA